MTALLSRSLGAEQHITINEGPLISICERVLRSSAAQRVDLFW